MNTIPTIDELYNDILTALQNEFTISLNPFGNAFLVVLAGVLAGVFKMAYYFIGQVQNNIWVDTCDYDTLIRYGNTILGRLPFPAVQGEYTVAVTGTVGAVIPAGSTFLSNDSSTSPSKLFLVTTAFTFTTTSGTIDIIATVGGEDSALIVGDTLTITAPVVNVNPTAIVTVVLVNAEDTEDTEEYRGKVITKMQLEPNSWSASGFRLLGLDIVGVRQTYAYAVSASTGTVAIYLEGTTYGTPCDASSITDYETALDLVRPMGINNTNVVACPIMDVAITITMGSFASYTVAEKALILTALTNLCNNVRPFIASCDVVADRNDYLGTYNITSTISQAVVGKGFSNVSFTVDGTSETNWQADNGEIPYLISVTYA
jgi:uncharacterized phage protein gp47/JayE